MPALSASARRKLRAAFPRITDFPAPPEQVDPALRSVFKTPALFRSQQSLIKAVGGPLWRNAEAIAGFYARVEAAGTECTLEDVLDGVLRVYRLTLDTACALDRHVHDTLMADLHRQLPHREAEASSAAITLADVSAAASFADDVDTVTRKVRSAAHSAAPRGAAGSAGKAPHSAFGLGGKKRAAHASGSAPSGRASDGAHGRAGGRGGSAASSGPRSSSRGGKLKRQQSAARK